MLWPEATKITTRDKTRVPSSVGRTREKNGEAGGKPHSKKLNLNFNCQCVTKHSHSLGTATTTLQRHHGHFVRRSTLQTQSVCSAIATVDRTEPRLDNYFVRETDDKATYELKSSVNINMAPPKRAAMLAYATAVALPSAHART